VQGVCDLGDGQCKIPNGGYCSFADAGEQPLCASGYCLSAGASVGMHTAQPMCGTLGSFGKGCTGDDDCVAIAAFGGWSETFCDSDNQCKLPSGAVCGLTSGDQPICASGYCLGQDKGIPGGLALCGTLGSFGKGCTDDDDCAMLSFESRTASGDGTVNSVCSAHGECKIPNEAYCTFGPSGEQPLCASGWCLSSNILQGREYCGTLGPDGNGCERDEDCPQYLPSVEGVYVPGHCDTGKCLITEMGSCEAFPEEDYTGGDEYCDGDCYKPANGDEAYCGSFG